MKAMIRCLVLGLERFTKQVKQIILIKNKQHAYGIIDIVNVNDKYEVLVQVKYSRHLFRITPEEILKCDLLTDLFSQRDIRMLTYLGYANLHSPKYSIISKKNSDSGLIFTIKKQGQKKHLIKTAAELSCSESIIAEMRQIDALAVGYAAASESIFGEDKQKKKLILENK